MPAPLFSPKGSAETSQNASAHHIRFNQLLSAISREYSDLRTLWETAHAQNTSMRSVLSTLGNSSHELAPDCWQYAIPLETPPVTSRSMAALPSPKDDSFDPQLEPAARCQWSQPLTPRNEQQAEVTLETIVGDSSIACNDNSSLKGPFQNAEDSRGSSGTRSLAGSSMNEADGGSTSTSRSRTHSPRLSKFSRFQNRDSKACYANRRGKLHLSRKSHEHSMWESAMRIEEAADLEESETISVWRSRRFVQRMVFTAVFEAVTAFVMITNIAFIGWAIDYQADDVSITNPAGGSQPALLSASIYVYCFAFVLEAALRLFAAGPWEYLCGSDKYWNYIDVLAAIMSGFECMEAAFDLGDLKRLSAIKVVRLVRILRIFRIVRILRFVMALKTLLASIVSTLRSLFWAMVLLTLLIFGSALMFTQAATQAREDVYGSSAILEKNHLGITDIEGLEIYWGRMSRSMLTLFMAVANGVSWEIAYRSLDSIHWVWSCLYLLYIMFTYFAVLNVVTANFCQVAIEAAESDHDLIVRSLKAKQTAYKEMLRRLYNQIDANRSGTLSLAELEAQFQDEDAKVLFASLDLEPYDAWSLFKLLDESGDHTIDVDEFIVGCMRLRGNAKQIDMSALMTEQSWLVQELTEFINQMHEELAEIKETLTGSPGTRLEKVEAPQFVHGSGAAHLGRKSLANYSMLSPDSLLSSS